MKKLLLISLLLLIGQLQVVSQTTSFHVGPVFPMSDFGDEDIDKSRYLGAGTGLGIGIKYFHELETDGLSLFAGFDLNYNTLASDVRDDYEEDFDKVSDNLDVKFPKLINIPLSAGINYTYVIDENMSLYGDLGLALNFLKITKFVVEGEVRTNGYYDFNGSYHSGDLVDFSVSRTNDLATGFGVLVGGGLLLNDKSSFSINYFGVGRHKVKGEIETEIDNDSDTDRYRSFKTRVSYLTLSYGRFF